MPLQILTEIRNVAHFAEILKTNPGIIIIKFGAEWCGPCKQIERLVFDSFSRMPNNVQCFIIDVDICFDIYSFLKTKKMLNGIPALLCYYKENINYIPDDSVIGANVPQLNMFFQRCYNKSQTYN